MQIILYCMTYSYITIINMHIQALYWSCIELIKDVCLNHDRKVPNALWTTMCTHYIYYSCFNLSKVFIKVYNTDISIATGYLYCFWILPVLLPTLHTLTGHIPAVSFYSHAIVPFSSTESLPEYSISLVVWVTITLYCQCRTISFFQIYITWFSSCVS